MDIVMLANFALGVVGAGCALGTSLVRDDERAQGLLERAGRLLRIVSWAGWLSLGWMVLEAMDLTDDAAGSIAAELGWGCYVAAFATFSMAITAWKGARGGRELVAHPEALRAMRDAVHEPSQDQAEPVAVDPHADSDETPADPPQPEVRWKTCPDCAEPVRAEARICRYCRHAFDPVPATDSA